MSKMREDQKICSKCKVVKHEREYYMASSTLIHADGKLGVCKECLNSITDFQDRRSVIQSMRLIDRPFLSETYHRVRKMDIDNHLGIYMRSLGVPSYKYMNFGDSQFDMQDGIDFDEIDKEKENIDITEEEYEYLIDFWGRGFTLDEYEFLHTEYEKFVNDYEVDSRAIEILLQEASYQRLEIKKKREQGKPVTQDLKALQSLFTDANIKPTQETGANATDQATFGTLIRQFENEHPIPEPEEEWKDVDGVRKYMRVWFLGHLSRMLGLDNKYADEYEQEIKEHGVSLGYDEDELDEDGEDDK